MNQYIKKFFAILIVWALIFDSSTVMAVYAIKNNRMNKVEYVKVDENTRKEIEENNLQRLVDDKQIEVVNEEQTTINEPIISNQDNSAEIVEDVSKRTLYSRTIMNEDGKYRVEQSIYPMFKQVNGEFVDINNDFINYKSDGLYVNELDLSNKIAINLKNINNSKLGIIFENDNENKSVIEKSVAKITQVNNRSDIEIINEDYLVKTSISVKEKQDTLYYELKNVNQYKASEGSISINNGEYTFFAITYQDSILNMEIVEKDGKAFLKIDTSKIKDSSFTFDLKIGVNPLKRITTFASFESSLSGYQYSNTNSTFADTTQINAVAEVGYGKHLDVQQHFRSYFTFSKPTLQTKYGALEKANLKFDIYSIYGNQDINVNMSSTSVSPETMTWNNRNDYTWTKIGEGTKISNSVYHFDVLTYVNHLAEGGNKRAIELRGYEGSDHNMVGLYPNNVKLVLDYEYDFASDTKLTTSLNVHSKGRGKVHSISFNGQAAPTKNVSYTLKTYDKKGNVINATTKDTPNFTKNASKKGFSPIYITNYIKSTQKYSDKKINYDSGYLKRSRFKIDTYYDYEIKSNGETLISQGFMFYKVKPGDTLKSISKYYKVSISRLKTDNKFKKNKVKTGEVIFVRGASSYKKATGKNSASKNKKVNRNKMKFCATCGTKYKFVADPINPNTGNFFLVTSDVELNDSQEFSFYRSYNSIDMQNSGMFGYTWISDIEQRISFEDSKADFTSDEMEDIDDDLEVSEDEADGDLDDQLLFVKGDGNLITFKLENNKYVAEEHDKYEVIEYEEDKYAIKDLEKKSISYFDDSGTLTKIVDEKGRTIKLEYDSESELLNKIKTENREIKFTYNDENFVSEIILPNNSKIKYEYEDGNLTKVIDQLGAVEEYHYNEDNLMDYYIDKNGVKLAENIYDEEGKVLEQTTETGQTYKFTYEDDKTIVSDPEGNKKEYSYDELYRLNEETGEDGSSTQKFYDDRDNLIKEISGNNEITTYEYDNENNLIKQTNPDKTTIEHEYDSDNYVTKTIYNLDRYETFKYDENKNIIEHQDIYGNITLSEYDSASQLIKEIDSKGVVTTYTYQDGNIATTNIDNRVIETNSYDSLGNLIKSVDQDDNVTTFKYDLQGNLLEETNKLGSKTTYEYDNTGNVIKEVDSKGLVIIYKYDERDNQIEENIGGQITKSEYDSNNNLVKEIDANNNVTINEYDSNNNLVKTTDFQGNVETKKYDGNGNIIENIDVRGNITKSEYDSNNQVVKEIDSYGNKTETEYDEDGNEIKISDSRSNVEETKYEAGLPIEEIDINGNKTTFEYDEFQREIKVIEENANGKVIIEYEYDKYDNIIKESDNLGNVTTRKYDANDNVIEENINGKVTKTKYDALENVIEEIKPNGLVIESKYNKHSQLVEQIEGDYKTTFEYDKFSNEIKRIDPNNNVHQSFYEYDKLVKEINAKGIEITYEYDNFDQLLEIKIAGKTKEKNEYNEYGDVIYKEDDEATTHYTYNQYGQVASEKTNGYTKYFEYDEYENVIVEKDDKGILVTNTYDKYDNLIETKTKSNKVTTYKYDKSNQEIEVNNIDKTSEKTSYDLAGNEIKTVDGQGIITEFFYENDLLIKEVVNNKKIITYKYDEMDNVIEENDNGAITKTEYDLYNNVVKEISPNGNETNYLYDNNNNLIKTINPNKTTTSQKYDALNQVVEETNELGDKKTFVYDDWNNQVKLIDEMNYVYEYIYDDKSHLIKEVLPNKKYQTNTYDSNNNLLVRVDYNGNKTTMTYDYKNREASITSPNGLVQTNTYDKDDNLIKVVDSNKRSQETIYNDKDQVVEEKTNGKTISKFTYNSKGQKIKETNANSVVTSYEYDSFNQLSKEQTDKRFKKYTYDLDGNVIKENESNKKITSTTYDQEGNVTSVKENNLMLEKNKYDEMNRLVEQTNEKNITTKNTYDKAGNILKVEEVYNDGKDKKTRLIEKNTYDKLSRNIIKENTLSAKTSYEYDSVGNIIKEKDALNNVQEYNYDGNGNIIKYKDQENKVISYKYDSMNNVVLKDSIGKKSANRYDKYGNIIKTTDDYDYTTSYQYDKFNRLIQEEKANKSKITYQYDNEDNLIKTKSKSDEINKKYNAHNELIKATNKNGALSYKYDNLGNVVEYKDVNQQSVKYKYDKQNNVKEIKYANKKIVYTYNGKNLLTSTKEDSKVIEKYSYDGLGRLLKESKGNGITTSYTYDDLDRILKIKARNKANKQIESLSYTYNLNDSITSETKIDQKGKQVKTMKYNARDELVESTLENKKGKIKNSYAYDIEGNKTIAKNGKIKERYTYNKRGQLTKIKSDKGIKTYEYDKNGNVSSIKENDGTINTITYDDFNQMITYKNKQQEFEYKYDGNENRIETKTTTKVSKVQNKEEVANQFDALATKIEYLEKSFNCDISLNASGDYSELGYSYNSDGKAKKNIKKDKVEVVQYLTNGSIDEAQVLSEDSSNNKKDNTYVYGYNRIKSKDNYYLAKLNDSVSKLTNKQGKITKSLEYSDYGKELNGYQNGFAYNGEMVDESGLQYLRARYLDLNAGQFLQKDSYLGEQDSIVSQNQYIYVMNNPYKYVDTSGNKAKTLTLAQLMGKTIGATLSGAITGKKPDPPKPTDMAPLYTPKSSWFNTMKEAVVDGVVDTAKDNFNMVKQFVTDPVGTTKNAINGLKYVANPNNWGKIYKEVKQTTSKMIKDKGLLYTLTYGSTRIIATAATTKGAGGGIALTGKATKFVMKKGGKELGGFKKAGKNVAILKKGNMRYAVKAANSSKKSASKLREVYASIKKNKTIKKLSNKKKTYTIKGSWHKYKSNKKCAKIKTSIGKTKIKSTKKVKVSYKNVKVKKKKTNINKTTGTVWDDIKVTQQPRKGSTIPKSFELKVGSKKIWVHPNATKHMVEYSSKKTSHSKKINEQQLLRSLQAGVKKVTSKGYKYDKIIKIDSWEFIFSAPRKTGQLPVLKHALYKP